MILEVFDVKYILFIKMNTTAINKLRQELLRRKLDALLITKRVNVAYLSGFKGEGELLITPTKKILIVDFRFEEQAAKEAKSFQIWRGQSFHPLEGSIFRLVKKLKLKRLGFEAPSLSYEFYRKLKGILKSVKLAPTSNIVERLRAIKNAEEIKLLKKAAALSIKSFAFAKQTIRPGRKEAEVARELQYFMRKYGAEDCAFDIIVASGKRSSMPHAPTSHRTIKGNEAVLVDLGVRYSGYNSDLTRMVFLGTIGDKIRQTYEIVLQAQKLAIKAIKTGVKIWQIDKIARRCIAKKGLGAFFGHALGHGIGKEVHEYPSISPQNQDILKQGMVFTVEPGVYIPGWGGIRVEDMVLVTKNGCEILTKR